MRYLVLRLEYLLPGFCKLFCLPIRKVKCRSLLFWICPFSVLKLRKLKKLPESNYNRTEWLKKEIFKNFVLSLEPGETLSNSASHYGSKLCTAFLNIAKYFKTMRCGCVYFFNLLKTSTVICVNVLYLHVVRTIMSAGSDIRHIISP